MVRWRRPPWVAPTSHGAWLLVVAVALVAGGVLWGVRLVRDAGLLLACLAATSFAAASAGAVVHAVALARRRPRPVGPTHVEAGETARWSLTTDRPGASLPAWVLWRAPEGRWLRALVEGRSDLLLALPRRGSYQIRADGLTFTDPLGLWRVRVPLGEGATVVVLPRPVPVVLPSIDGAAPAGRLRADRGEELAGLRDYRRGDRLSSVHWRQSARLDRLVVVDAERRTRARLTVALDTRAGSYGADRLQRRTRPGAEADAFETAVSLAAGVLRAWESTGADVRLVLGRRLVEADAGERGGIAPLLEALALAEAVAGPQEPGAREPAPREPGAQGDGAPDVVITGTAALADVGRGLAAPRAAGELVLVEPAAGPAAEPAAGARGVRAPATWRLRTVPAGAGAARGEGR